MPTLNWIGKEAVETHHKDVPFRLLEPIPELSSGEIDSGNMIVQGDNLLALKALLPRYAGQVKCIYIDPPYNTGNEGWVYDDNVNSPEIRKWLGEVVGKEGETLDRHDRWLCMMYPRLVLLRQFLCEDGAIFVSLDDNEVGPLRLLMDEIFGSSNFVTTIAWQKIFTIKNSAKHFSEMHDYVVVYARKKELWKRNLLPRSTSAEEDYSNPDNDERGDWTSNALQSRNFYSKGTYEIKCPGGRIVEGPPRGTYWRMEESKLWELDRDNRVWWGKSGNNSPRIKKFLDEAKDGVVPSTWWEHRFAGTNSGAKTELRDILGEQDQELFNTPKPWQLIQRIIQIATDKDSIIMDSFAGSGSTGHAVLKQNARDGGSRQFILIEMNEAVATGVTSKRIANVVNGYPYVGVSREELYREKLSFSSLKNADQILGRVSEIEEAEKDRFSRIKKELKDGELVVTGELDVKEELPGLGSGAQFCRLSEQALFDEFGSIRLDVTFDQLAEFVWFMETGTGLASSAILERKERTPYLGTHKGRAIFLLYNGILKDKSELGGNVLNGRTLEYLADIQDEFDGPKVIYGARTRFDKSKLTKLGIVFHQLPYELAVKTWF
ncbi:site-specific DNA-methyltransferase [Duganella sp. CT11-25]|uniref:site-specific DNA-methyltransferase n=1 Tax=unclassified Duganella TaxID=2636909 RepID=UPI0039AF9F7B